MNNWNVIDKHVQQKKLEYSSLASQYTNHVESRDEAENTIYFLGNDLGHSAMLVSYILRKYETPDWLLEYFFWFEACVGKVKSDHSIRLISMCRSAYRILSREKEVRSDMKYREVLSMLHRASDLARGHCCVYWIGGQEEDKLYVEAIANRFSESRASDESLLYPHIFDIEFNSLFRYFDTDPC